MAGKVHAECRDGVAWIVLDHPPLNVVTTSMAHETAVETLDALEDYAEGVAAFLEKRRPVWRNR